MTSAEFDALAPGTKIYLPDADTVGVCLLYPRVGVSEYYTLLAAPDELTGEVSSKRPCYARRVDLIDATTNKREAWVKVLENLEKRAQTVRGMIEGMRVDEQINAASVVLDNEHV